MTNMFYSTSTTYSITTNNTGPLGNYYGTINTSVGSNGSYWITNGNNFSTKNPADLEVKGDAEFGGDIKWKGRSLGKLLESIEDRLAILQPDPAKLEKFAALKKAYDHYKLMEKLISEE
jgi:hypothetical protein